MTMNLLRRRTSLFGIVTMLILVGCASSGTTSDSSSANSSGSSIEVNNGSLTLADHLQKISGVIVQGSGSNIRVFVRGVQSAAGNNEALFVIDGSRAGRSYQEAASRVDVNDIDRIRVIKGSEAGSRYGFEGSSGVIEIRTKRN